jgi:hypothetical protein
MILIAAVVLALAVPFGTALTLDRRAPGPVAVTTVHTARTDLTALAPHPLTEAAMLMLTGCLLIALAAAVRRA